MSSQRDSLLTFLSWGPQSFALRCLRGRQGIEVVVKRSLRQGMRSLEGGMDFAYAHSSELLTPLQRTRPCGMSPSPITPGGPPTLHPHCGAWVPRRTSLRETGDWTRPGFERVAKPTPPARGLEKGGCLFRCNSRSTCPGFRRSLGRPGVHKSPRPGARRPETGPGPV